ncbi:hypothetical protein ACFV2Q_20880 [Streptomyces sp. NPDC059650]|uniref:hypothetical protein n=1 Tax=Streptomyces sp. NPDC059650 TaxID=3346896 RepID=UPI0036D1284E
MQEQRAETYARCTAELEGDHTGPGAEAIFDQALTNGLAAVVSAEWGEAAATEKNGRRVRSAAALLDVVEEKAQEDPEEPGVFVIPDPAPLSAPNETLRGVWPWEGVDSLALDTRIHVIVLRSGIKSTQPVRHASGRGGLQREHIEALLALDHHKGLGTLGGEHADRAWEGTKADDRAARARAFALLLRLGDEEASNRAERARELHPSYHPKHNPDGLELQDCPVCGYTAFSPDHGDEHGMGIGVGQCLVCHYERTAGVAAEEAEKLIYQLRWADS